MSTIFNEFPNGIGYPGFDDDEPEARADKFPGIKSITARRDAIKEAWTDEQRRERAGLGAVEPNWKSATRYPRCIPVPVVHGNDLYLYENDQHKLAEQDYWQFQITNPEC